jgi:hypothetical protein
MIKNKINPRWFRVTRPIGSLISRSADVDEHWCEKNCIGKFTNSPMGSNFWFEKEEDAMMFKMANS